MAKAPRNRTGGSQDDYDGRDPHDREPVDDPDEHLEIERRRFRGGLPPTPELYARAREQWKTLPGALAKPPMGEDGADPGSDPPPSPPKTRTGGKGGEQ